MECRSGCGACCIAPSISAAIPGMPRGKPAGARCVQLADDMSCLIFGQSDRPKTCERFKAEPDICGDNRDEALSIIKWLEESSK